MAIQAVIFDLGGVILRTEDQTARRKWEARLGLREGELERAVFGCDASVRASIGKADDDDVWNSVAARFGFKDGDAKQFRHDFFAGDHIDVTLVQFIRDLRPQYKTGILSNAWLSARRTIMERFGLDQVVDTIVISAEEGIAKPDARIYQLAAQRLSVAPTDAIFVDDMPENAEGARRVGMRGVQFKNTAQAISEVKQYLGE
ncbi:MAG: HAD family phosphatase [Chloroflexi bacterium]|nr:HAD family phosphatase [Chloroflexota bacterium]